MYIYLIILIIIIYIAIKYFAHGTLPIIGGRDIIKNLASQPRSRSESAVIKILEEIVGAKFPTVYPDWLIWRGRRLELDGYNRKLKIALEFSGPLHTKWFPAQEPYEKYFERITRDMIKKKLCKKHGVGLIVIDMTLPLRHVRTYLKSRLCDYGIIPRPPDYIDEQTVEPYRNEYLEKELNLRM